MDEDLLKELEAKALLVESGAHHDGFGWLTVAAALEAFRRCCSDRDEAPSQTVATDLLQDEEFKNVCSQVREEVKACRLADWKILPTARMMLVPRMLTGALMQERSIDADKVLQIILLPSKNLENPPRIEVQYFPLLKSRQLGGPRQSQIQLLYRETTREVEGVESRATVQVLVPPTPCLEVFATDERLHFDSDIFPSLRLLQALAKDERWDAFAVLTAHCVGDAKELTTLISKTVVWSVDAERLRVALFPLWQETVRAPFPLAPLQCAEELFNMQTLEGLFQSCEGCPLRIDRVTGKNPEVSELGIASKSDAFLPFAICSQCRRSVPQHKTFILPTPVVLAWQKPYEHDELTAPQPKRLELVFEDFDAGLELGDGIMQRYAASVTEMKADSEQSSQTVMLFCRGGTWFRSSDEFVWDEPYVEQADVLGVVVNFVAYLRRGS